MAGDTITVAYELDGAADFAAGAVRMFWYDTAAEADTMTEAPTATAIADAEAGMLTLDIGADAQVGTFGLTYDASNASAGTVRFSDLMVAGTPVLFLAPPEPPVSPTPGPTTGEPTEPAPGGGGGDKAGLPVTGSSLPLLAGIGGGAAVMGGLALWAARRRRPTFTA